MKRSISRRTFLARGTSLAAGLAVPACLVGPRPRRALAAQETYDLLIVGGTLVDGTGSPRRREDLAIRQGRIARIGDLAGAQAERRLDATGLVVTPGFIDMHTHSDRTLLEDGHAQSAIRQGATTHVIGNCGSSPAPASSPQTAHGHTFQSYGEFLAALADAGTSVNIGGLVGHNAVRAAVMGFARRAPDDAEMRRMKELVAEAMLAGAVGMSTGLVSPPGTYSRTEEIVELARQVAQRGGIYASHIRGEASTLVDSVREAIEVGRQANLPVQISHHKAAGKENWGSTRVTLKMIEQANAAGQRVRVDVYPYRAGSAGLSQLVPPWAHEGGTDAMLKRLEDTETRQRIARDMTEGTADWPNFFRIDWDDIQIASVRSDANRQWVGKKVGDIARARGCAGVDACIDLLIEERSDVQMINFIMDEAEVQGVLSHRLSMIGSDGTAVSPEIYQGKPHPRYYGCFPRVLGHYCRELKLFDLETAIHKMTGMQAEQLALPSRGLLRESFAADVVLLDFEKVIDRATFDDPHQYPDGIGTVIVNGQIVVHGGEHLGAMPGQVLRPERA